MQFLAYYPIIQSFKIKLNLVFLLCWPNIFNNNNNNRGAKNLESGFSSIVFAYNSSKKKSLIFSQVPMNFQTTLSCQFLVQFSLPWLALKSLKITPWILSKKQVNNTRDILHNYFPFLRHEKKEKNELVTPTLFYFLLLKVANAIYLPKFIHNRHLELKNFLPLSNVTLTLVRGEYLNKRQKKVS